MKCSTFCKNASRRSGYNLAALGTNCWNTGTSWWKRRNWPDPDLYTYNGDPAFNPTLLNYVNGTLLTPAYAKSLCQGSTRTAAPAAHGNGSGVGDTTVASTADRWGNMVSWVNSNYDGSGSGITVPGLASSFTTAADFSR